MYFKTVVLQPQFFDVSHVTVYAETGQKSAKYNFFWKLELSVVMESFSKVASLLKGLYSLASYFNWVSTCMYGHMSKKI